eukprot:6383937-Prymnesium_polylepis.2
MFSTDLFLRQPRFCLALASPPGCLSTLVPSSPQQRRHRRHGRHHAALTAQQVSSTVTNGQPTSTQARACAAADSIWRVVATRLRPFASVTARRASPGAMPSTAFTMSGVSCGPRRARTRKFAFRGPCATSVILRGGVRACVQGRHVVATATAR